MRTRTLMSLLAAMLWAVAAFAGDDAINGTWKGSVEPYPGGVPGFTVTLNIQNATGGTSVLEWEGGKCSGILSGYPRSVENSYIYDVHYTEGRRTSMDRAGCIDGMVSLYLPTPEKALYSWNGNDLDGSQRSAAAVLKKQ